MTEQDKQALIKHFCSRDCGEAAEGCTIMPCHEIELIQEFPTTEADSDTISRAKAIDALETVGYDFSESELSEVELEEVCGAVSDVRQDMIDRIKQLPPAQPQRIKGRWLYSSYDDESGFDESWTCDQCGYMTNIEETNFCPDCGADMREVTE